MSATRFEKIACLGLGKMGDAFVRGANLPKDRVTVTGRRLLQDKLAGKPSNIPYTITDNRTAVTDADCIITTVKPNQLEALLKEIRGYVRPDALILSAIAGKTTPIFHELLGCDTQPIALTMPNTPALVKRGVIGLYINPFVTPFQAVEVHKILNQLGDVIAVNEQDKLKDITALSGCGPAYYFLAQKMVYLKAKKLGFDDKTASIIASRTMWGASALQEHSGLSAEEEIARVASKGGATEQALKHFEGHGIEELYSDAIEAALQQTYKLGESAAKAEKSSISQMTLFQSPESTLSEAPADKSESPKP